MWLWRNREIHLPTHELSTQDLANVDRYVAETEASREAAQPGRIEAYAEQGAKHHVAGNTAERVQDRGAHGDKTSKGRGSATLPRDGEFDPDARTGARVALHVDRAPMCVDDSLDDVEPEPCAGP